MQTLGTVKGNEIVLGEDDGKFARQLVTELPDPSGNVRSVQLAVAISSFQAGDVLISNGTTWSKVEVKVPSLSFVPTNILCPRVGTDVKIRWTDPVNTDTCVWKHTRVLRKYGSYPTSYCDGVIVTDSYTRDYYKKDALHDYVPDGTEDKWFYKLFVFNEDEVVFTDDTCNFQPIEVSWKNISSVIQAGLAPKVFNIGDSIVVQGVNVNSPWYNESLGGTEFEIVAFNQATPTDTTKARSITLATYRVPADKDKALDEPRGDYVLTGDTYSISSSKPYFKLVDGEYITVYLRVGYRIPEGEYYEQVPAGDTRRTTGGNRWKVSSLRQWLKKTEDEEKYAPLVAFAEAEDGQFLNAVVEVKNTTATSVSDGNGSEVTTDKFFLFSLTEIFGKDNTNVTYDKTTDTFRDFTKTYYLLKEGEYVECTAEDFDKQTGDFKRDEEGKIALDYLERKVTSVHENEPIEYFVHNQEDTRIHTDGSIVKAWHLRSPVISDNGLAYRVATDGACDQGEPKDLCGLVLGCVLA